jgi:phospholipase/carboxylesterase
MIRLPLGRRSFLKGAAVLTMAAHPYIAQAAAAAAKGRLQTRPAPHPSSHPLDAGLHRLGLGDARDGLLYVPSRNDPTLPVPLILMLHGAGGIAGHVVPLLQGQADQHGVLVLAPDSRAATWDIIRGGYGPDIAFIDRALGYVFERFRIDPLRLAVAGFSDGASYALSLGLMNGDLFRDVLAFSPGFVAPTAPVGMPRIFISHGNRDEVLPVERCGRRLARELTAAHYDADYREFAGGHIVPPEMVDAAVKRMLG